MGITLPGEVAWVLDLLGVEWPNIDEDELRSIADDLRSLAEEMRGHTGDAKSDIADMLGVNSLDSLKRFEALWNKLADGHLDQLAQGFDLLGTGLDVAALVVVGLKLAAIVQLVVLAAELIADQAAAPFTFGASEAVAAAQIGITRTIVKQLLEQAVQSVEQQLLSAVTGPVFAALEAAGMELAGQLLGNALGTDDGIDLGKVADAGGGAFQQGVRESEQQVRGMARNVVDNPLASAGSLASGQGVPTGD
ncbi:WXG100-like domain-containing protein [Saccharothrix variisporea]|uniref:Outer membrane channel protein CpnT-like N-terminal domain-containing protein n=1 Tax=Saccharothrix variisporea TaxID=543527 RepID=A0A495XQ53_9PSEU|nr:hypothetical protein [Saccharothrix variisporea]RKT75044.1 hypothetical protein DFJ66_8421 [Saccharothrix variisporea]